MKYGVIPTRLAERLALWAGRVPIPLLDCIFPLLKARSLMAGVRLGIFEALKEGPRPAPEVAASLGLDPAAAESLMRMLVHSDYLEWEKGAYRLSAMAARSLVSGAKRDLTGYVNWNYPQWDMLGGLEDMIRTGQGLDFHRTMRSGEDWGQYQRGMLELARFDSSTVAARIPVKAGAARLLDVAGGHGLYGAALCRRHPPLKSEVLDLPAAVEHARALARAEGIDDVVTHRAGDLVAEAWGGPYDVILLSNILHHFGPGEDRALLAKARRSLSPGGTVAIWDFEAPDASEPPTEGDGAALFFRLTSTARCYAGREFAEWVRDAGFSQVTLARPVLSPGSLLVTGRA